MTIDSRTASTVDVNAFRKAMGSFPTGVTLVTVACDDGTMHGVTVGNQHRPPGSAMFDGVPLEPGVTGCPILAGAAASFDCRLRQSYHAGDHLIVLGEVVTLIHRPQLEPLIFHAGTYKSLAQKSRRGRTNARRFGRDLGAPGQRPHRRAA